MEDCKGYILQQWDTAFEQHNTLLLLFYQYELFGRMCVVIQRPHGWVANWSHTFWLQQIHQSPRIHDEQRVAWGLSSKRRSDLARTWQTFQVSSPNKSDYCSIEDSVALHQCFVPESHVWGMQKHNTSEHKHTSRRHRPTPAYVATAAQAPLPGLEQRSRNFVQKHEHDN